MRGRILAAVAVSGSAVGLSVGLFAAPAAAQTSMVTVTPVPVSATYPGSESATATVTGDVNPVAGGTLTYSLFVNSSTCGGTAASSQTVTLASDGTVPDSATTGSLGAGVDSVEANYNGDDMVNDAGSACEPFIVGQATPTVGISDVPASGIYGDSFLATVVTDGDGTPSVASSTPSVCTVSGFTVTYVGIGTCTVTGSVGDGTNYSAASGSPQDVNVTQNTPIVGIANAPASGTYGGTFLLDVLTNGDGVTSIASSTPSVCTMSGFTVDYVGVGACTVTASVAAGTNYSAATGSPQTITVLQATPTVGISNLPSNGTYGGGFTATVVTNGGGATSVTSDTTNSCTVSGFTVSYVGVGPCILAANAAATTDYAAASVPQTSFTIGQATPTVTISNLPASGAYLGSFVATVNTDGDGPTTTVTSSTTTVCTVGSDGHTVSYKALGTCSLSAHVAAGTDFAAASGSAQTISVGRATPSITAISNLPGNAVEFGTFVASVFTNGDGTTSVTSSSTGVCTVGGPTGTPSPSSASGSAH